MTPTPAAEIQVIGVEAGIVIRIELTEQEVAKKG
jgi:hypothetical protein